ncbi:GntR family transcriptional regulator [Mesorhizobium sp. AaZ16]|uniref:GntR family transcriptional regulator n=1 Tax=Mesorhizobium sp. AaZ16 TaxID=3402289 RepID=UPI00374EFAE1
MQRPTRRAGRDDVADLIARDIQAGLHGRGAWLKQIDLQKGYSATRIEIRRALDRLVLRRLVQHEHNKGYRVYAPDENHTDQIRDVRVVLETAAAERILETVDAAAIEELRNLARRFADLLMTGTLLQQYEANLAFHHRMAQLCPNRELADLVMEYRGRGASAPLTQWSTRARIEKSAREHMEIVEALAARDLPRLKLVVAAHIRQVEASETEASSQAGRFSPA